MKIRRQERACTSSSSTIKQAFMTLAKVQEVYDHPGAEHEQPHEQAQNYKVPASDSILYAAINTGYLQDFRNSCRHLEISLGIDPTTLRLSRRVVFPQLSRLRACTNVLA